MKKVLVILGHPYSKSYCTALAKEYIKGAKDSGKEVKTIELGKMNFKKVLEFGYKEMPKLEADLVKAQKLIIWADYLVFSYPIWWATAPSLVKSFIERTFLPHFAFKYNKYSWDKFLKNKSARLLVTMDSPPIYYKLFIRDPNYKMMKANLGFCGIKPVKKKYFGSIKMSSEEKRKKWLKKSYKIGFKD